LSGIFARRAKIPDKSEIRAAPKLVFNQSFVNCFRPQGENDTQKTELPQTKSALNDSHLYCASEQIDPHHQQHHHQRQRCRIWQREGHLGVLFLRSADQSGQIDSEIFSINR